MNIERLSFDDGKHHYDPMEASIHLTRYMLVKQYVSGKRVLDIACGEGYGSFLIKKWGAKSVIGVDIDTNAILKADENFKSNGITFICGDAQALDIKDKFDVIVSLETIEHVENDSLYLHQLKQLLADDGVLVISCPNDYWYFKDDECNPYHLRKYTFELFIDKTESVLGKASQVLLGSNIFGYANYFYESKNNDVICNSNHPLFKDIIDSKDVLASLVGNTNDTVPTITNCLYYVGIWGGSGRLNNTMTASLLSSVPASYSYNTVVDDIKQKNNFIQELEKAVKLLTEDNQLKNQYISELLTVKQKLDETILAKDKYILELTEGKDKYITELTESKDKYITELTASKDKYILELTQAKNYLDEVIATKNKYIVEIEEAKEKLLETLEFNQKK